MGRHLYKLRGPIGVFLDFGKAYDTVLIPILLRELEGYGVWWTVIKSKIIYMIAINV